MGIRNFFYNLAEPTSLMLLVHGSIEQAIRTNWNDRRTLIEHLIYDIKAGKITDLSEAYKGKFSDNDWIETVRRQYEDSLFENNESMRSTWSVFKAHVFAAMCICSSLLDIDVGTLPPSDVSAGFLADLEHELSNSGTLRDTINDREIIVPFVVEFSDIHSDGILLQFRVEVIEVGKGGSVYLCPEQSFLSLSEEFYKSVFENARDVVIKEVGKKWFHYDYRVYIEKATQRTNSHGERICIPLVGPSAGAAAVRALHGAATGKKPDRGVIAIAGINQNSEVFGVSIKQGKVKTIVDCTWLDTIIVGDSEKHEEAMNTIQSVGWKQKPNQDSKNKGTVLVKSNNPKKGRQLRVISLL